MPLSIQRPNRINQTRICIHDSSNRDFSGELYNPYLPAPIPFAGVAELLGRMEGLMDRFEFPQSYYQPRSFHDDSKIQALRASEERVTRHMEEKVFETKVGRRATFIVQIQFRQNATWQGVITWSEKKQERHFRSTLEMIKLMDEAMEEARKEDEAFATW